ncbi:MAG: hypothetical protein ACI8RZ_003345 [Myxococcota bacterium]|jgi:hypothetical protein
MRIGSIIGALLSGFASAEEPAELARWQSVVAVEVPEKCRAVGEDGGLRIDCGGAALLLETATGSDPRKVALQRQLEPFSQAGIPISPPETVPCTLVGEPAECLEVTLSIHGSEMILRSGMVDHWVGTCLYRGAEQPAVCDAVFSDSTSVR